MILSSLCSYYDILKNRNDFTGEEYENQEIKYIICLSKDGIVEDIIPAGKQEGKRLLKRPMDYPVSPPGNTTIMSYFVEYRPRYLFGLKVEGGAFTASDETAVKSHKAFREKAAEQFAKINSPLAAAYLKFSQDWDPEKECENPLLLKIIKDYDKSYYAFCLAGQIGQKLQDDPLVKKSWEAEYARRQSAGGEPETECSVYGEVLPVARLHDKIKGIAGGAPSGCSLVCFNSASENSYGKTQSYNSGVSVKAMKRYTKALNYLLSHKEHCTRIGNLTVVHFALEGEEDLMTGYVNAAMLEQETESQVTLADVDTGLSASVRTIARGENPAFDNMEQLDNFEYCMFALTPNMSRVSIRFYYRNTFGVLRRNIKQYHEDFAVGNLKRAPSVYRIARELQRPENENSKAKSKKTKAQEVQDAQEEKSKVSIPPDLTSQLLQCIINGTPFPEKILQTTVMRIKTDSDDEKSHFIKMNDIRIGLLKACLIRKNRNRQEEIKMSLNKENKNPAYLCGRLFAVLEKIQQESAGTDLNKTIKDSYFSSACATPAVIFPGLFKLAQNHLGKLEKGRTIYFNKLIQDIIDGLEDFPKTLPLEEQATFIVGYYQQTKDFYVKKNTTEEF